MNLPRQRQCLLSTSTGGESSATRNADRVKIWQADLALASPQDEDFRVVGKVNAKEGKHKLKGTGEDPSPVFPLSNALKVEKAPQVVDDEAPSSSAAENVVVGGADDGDVDIEGGSQHFGGDMVSQKAVMEIVDISKMVVLPPPVLSEIKTSTTPKKDKPPPTIGVPASTPIPAPSSRLPFFFGLYDSVRRLFLRFWLQARLRNCGRVRVHGPYQIQILARRANLKPSIPKQQGLKLQYSRTISSRSDDMQISSPPQDERKCQDPSSTSPRLKRAWTMLVVLQVAFL
ncbi:hypothetical protein PILCRDRAFT_6904 [Piloderma croceum F 1598]|uniref:Uncharacterized protein n=1 Tax=Piloderma croceum (strain F 1598) TaxID=765440 RepID=A0A0C3FVH7_PILCF|nr:hypothetical protein PILCRDRAFT_6904 [Piloderma croceum F 1598]